VPPPTDSLPLIISDSGVLLLYPETQFNIVSIANYNKFVNDVLRDGVPIL